MIRRTLDPTHANAVANHPEVRKWLGGDGPIDLSAAVRDLANFCFVTEHGAIVGVAIGSGVYDVHTLFLPEGRGVESREAIAAGADYMFTRTDATELRTLVPHDNRAADVAARRAGFEPLFTRRVQWDAAGAMVEATVYRLLLDRWALTSTAAQAMGAWFHDTLEAAKMAAGATSPVHADDAAHDRMAGAVCLMVRAGQPEKALRFYNVWATSAGYATLTLLRARPIVIDIQDAIVEATPMGGLEVLLCR